MNAAGLNEAITQGDKDFSADQQDEAGRTYAIYFGAYQTAAGLIVRQARDQGVKAKFIGADALVIQEFGNVIGATGEGTLMTFPPDPRNVPAAKAVVDQFMACGGSGLCRSGE
jgi:branched-chain amino acid transport system substrate-binding protein